VWCGAELALSLPLLTLQRQLAHTFANTRLLEQALTHRSFSADHYERLEFLGDSVLNLAISALLYEQFAKSPEGDLSRTRANLVKQDTLVTVATTLGLSAVLRLGEGELKSGGRQRPSILADAVEAIIGAVYLDAGYDPAAQLVRRLFRGIDINPAVGAMGKDAKTALQEWLQGRRMGLPHYRVAETTGAAHQQMFAVVCEVVETGHTELGRGLGLLGA
jgi:ribonuclease III